MTNINHRSLLAISASSIIARPILDYFVCPYAESFQSETLNKLCNTAVVTTSLVPTAIGASYGSYGLHKQVSLNGVASIALKYGEVAFNLVTPAGLGMVAVQSFYYDRDTPIAAFLVGVAKSSFEVTLIGAISNTLPVEKTVLNSGLIATTVATATNVLHYTAKELANGGELSFATLSNATDYAFGYAIARPIYNTGQILLNNGHPVASASCYFAAPIARGFILGAVGKGSVLMPGSDYGVTSNAIDGTAIATASLATKYSGEGFKHLAGYSEKIAPIAGAASVSFGLLAATVGRSLYDDGTDEIISDLAEQPLVGASENATMHTDL